MQFSCRPRTWINATCPRGGLGWPVCFLKKRGRTPALAQRGGRGVGEMQAGKGLCSKKVLRRLVERVTGCCCRTDCLPAPIDVGTPERGFAQEGGMETRSRETSYSRLAPGGTSPRFSGTCSVGRRVSPAEQRAGKLPAMLCATWAAVRLRPSSEGDAAAAVTAAVGQVRPGPRFRGKARVCQSPLSPNPSSGGTVTRRRPPAAAAAATAPAKEHRRARGNVMGFLPQVQTGENEWHTTRVCDRAPNVACGPKACRLWVGRRLVHTLPLPSISLHCIVRNARTGSRDSSAHDTPKARSARAHHAG